MPKRKPKDKCICCNQVMWNKMYGKYCKSCGRFIHNLTAKLAGKKRNCILKYKRKLHYIIDNIEMF